MFHNSLIVFEYRLGWYTLIHYKDIYPQNLTVNIMTNERIDLFN